jgi:hypothetical protein
MAMVRGSVVVGLAVLSLAWTAGQALAAPAEQGECPGNLLKNPNFEEGSRKTEGEGTSLSSAVANGWSPWFVRGDATFNREPEFKVEQIAIGGDPFRVRSGGQSMKWFTTWGTHTAGIYQRVAARPGTPFTFSIYGMAYSGEADGWNPDKRVFESDPMQPGRYRMSVGIDPTGAVPPIGSPPPGSVIWSEPSLTTDQWALQKVSAAAQGPAITVYVKGQPEFAVKHNDSFWEDACLVVGGAAAPARPAPVQPAPAAAKPARPAAQPVQAAQPIQPAAKRAQSRSRRFGATPE